MILTHWNCILFTRFKIVNEFLGNKMNKIMKVLTFIVYGGIDVGLFYFLPRLHFYIVNGVWILIISLRTLRKSCDKGDCIGKFLILATFGAGGYMIYRYLPIPLWQ